MTTGSITVIGGHTGSALTGLVTIPGDFSSIGGSSLLTTLQNLLGSSVGGSQPGDSDSVLSGSLTLTNYDAANQFGAVSFGSSSGPGILEITDTDGTNDVTTSIVPTNITGTVPANYTTLLVEAPGGETITGNGASNFLAVFGNNSTVNFNTGGGSGTVVAGGGGDNVQLVGSAWTFAGSTDGNETVQSVAATTSISVYGAGNVVGIGTSNVTVSSSGTGDLVEFYNGGAGVVSLGGSGDNVLVNGGSVTVYAAAGSSSNNAFFENAGGTLDFINNSTAAQTVSGGIGAAAGGNVTAFGGAGGGTYIGGVGGNNSLVGGTGLVNLYSAGGSSTLIAGSSLAGGNNLFAEGTGGTTMIGAAGSGINQFDSRGSTGTQVVSTRGSGAQTYFVGSDGSEKFYSSTVTGAHNNYYFTETNANDENVQIFGFSTATSSLYINAFAPGAPSTAGISINGITSLSTFPTGYSAGVNVSLNDGTTLKIYGLTLAQANAESVIGKGYSL